MTKKLHNTSLLLLSTLIFVSGNIYAYSVTVHNYTNDTVWVNVDNQLTKQNFGKDTETKIYNIPTIVNGNNRTFVKLKAHFHAPEDRQTILTEKGKRRPYWMVGDHPGSGYGTTNVYTTKEESYNNPEELSIDSSVFDYSYEMREAILGKTTKTHRGEAKIIYKLPAVQKPKPFFETRLSNEEIQKIIKTLNTDEKLKSALEECNKNITSWKGVDAPMAQNRSFKMLDYWQNIKNLLEESLKKSTKTGTTGSPVTKAPVRVENLNAKEKTRNSVLGAIIGDAMGMPTEFIETYEDLSARYPKGLRSFSDFKKDDFKIINGKQTAIHTSDTAMSKIALDTLVNSKKSNWTLDKTMEEMARNFVKGMKNKDGWAADYRAPGRGNIEKYKIIETRIANGIKTPFWYLAGDSKGGGCGSIIRAYPCGLIFANDPEKAATWAVEQSKITHGAPIALAACAAMASGVANAISGKNLDVIIDQMIKAANKYDQDTGAMIKDTYEQAKINKPKCTNFDQMLKVSQPVFAKYEGMSANKVIALALYVFAVSPENIENAIALGANMPGNGNNIASLAGALVGAYGKSKIPDSWTSFLESSLWLVE